MPYGQPYALGSATDIRDRCNDQFWTFNPHPQRFVHFVTSSAANDLLNSTATSHTLFEMELYIYSPSFRTHTV